MLTVFLSVASGCAGPALARLPVAHPNPVFSLASVDRCFLARRIPGHTGWPLAPVGRPHPIRGSFNEPRGDAAHFGVDVEAIRNRAPVYSIGSGRVLGLRPSVDRIAIGATGAYFLEYWHVKPLVSLYVGEQVEPGQLIGHVVTAFYHPHISEYEATCGWINPMRPDGPLHVAADRERPVIGPLYAYVANGRAFAPFNAATDPALQTDLSTPESLKALHGVVDLRAAISDDPDLRMIGRPQLDLEVAAIRAFLAPLGDRDAHLGSVIRVYDGAVHLFPSALGTTIWHIWAFGTWRQNTGYFQRGPLANRHLGAAYVWHVGGRAGIDTRRSANGRYQYCVQALTINGRAASSCTPVVIDN